jgi:hypothetical protein
MDEVRRSYADANALGIGQRPGILVTPRRASYTALTEAYGLSRRISEEVPAGPGPHRRDLRRRYLPPAHPTA